jgi:transcriptional regulator with XRE-family HTH domain
MRDLELGRVVRVLRRRRGWRQQDCATRARVHRSTWSRLERGLLDGLTLQSVRRCLAVLEVRVDVTPRWRGADLDRMLDADHADLQSAWADRLRRWGWLVRVEVSFNRYGDRGRVDLVAWHASRRVLIVGEVKSALVDAQGLLGPLDVKVRVGPSVAESLGLGRARIVVPLLIVRDSGTVRRRLERLAPLFGRFSYRGRAAVGCLRHPDRLSRGDGLLVLSDLSSAPGRHLIRVGGERVRPPRTRASVEWTVPEVAGRARPG